MTAIHNNTSDPIYIQSPYVAYAPEALKQISTWQYLKALKQYSQQNRADSYQPLFKTLPAVTEDSIVMTKKPDVVLEKWSSTWNRRKEAAWFLLFKTLNRLCPALLTFFTRPLKQRSNVATHSRSPLIPTQETRCVLQKGFPLFLQNSLHHTGSQTLLNVVFQLKPADIKNPHIRLYQLIELDEALQEISQEDMATFLEPILTGQFSRQHRPEALTIIKQLAKAREERVVGGLETLLGQTAEAPEGTNIDFSLSLSNADTLEAEPTPVSPIHNREKPLFSSEDNGFSRLFNLLRESREWNNAFFGALATHNLIEPYNSPNPPSEQGSFTLLENVFQMVESHLLPERVYTHTQQEFLGYLQQQQPELDIGNAVHTSTALKALKQWIDAMAVEEETI